mgnify:CR=1 FL=1
MKNALDKNIAIQKVFYTLAGFAAELKETYPEAPNKTGYSDWKIEYRDYEQTFVLLLGGSTLVFVDAETDLYSIEVIYAHLRKTSILVATKLPRKTAQDFLALSLDSRKFSEKAPLSTFELSEEDGSAELVESLLNSFK